MEHHRSRDEEPQHLKPVLFATLTLTSHDKDRTSAMLLTPPDEEKRVRVLANRDAVLDDETILDCRAADVLENGDTLLFLR